MSLTGVKPGAKVSIATIGSDLTNNSRVAGDYDNSVDNWLEADVYMVSDYQTTAPAANLRVADLYVLFGNGESTEKFPEGGDGTTGSDDNPQGALFVGSYETINPNNAGVSETLCIPNVAINGRKTIRFVMQNVSGQIMDSGNFELYIIPKKFQSV